MLKRIRWLVANFYPTIVAACAALAVGIVGRAYGVLAGLWVILGGATAIFLIAFTVAFTRGMLHDWQDVKTMLRVIARGH